MAQRSDSRPENQIHRKRGNLQIIAQVSQHYAGGCSTVVTPASTSEASDLTFAPVADLCCFFSRYATGVESLLFTDDSQWLAAGRADGSIDLYAVPSRQLFMSFPGGENVSARCLGFVTKRSVKENLGVLNYRLFSAGLHGIITELDFNTQATRFSTPSLGGAVFALYVYKPLGLLITANDDGSIRFFRTYLDDFVSLDPKDQEKKKEDYSTEETLIFWKSLTRHDGRLLSVCLYDSERVFAGTADSRIIGWNVNTGIPYVGVTVDKPIISSQTSSEFLSHDTKFSHKNETLLWCLVPLPSHSLLASGDSTGTLYLWNIETFTPVVKFQHHQSDILGLASCPITGNTLFSVGVDGRLCIFSAISSRSDEKSDWILVGCRHPHLSDIRAIAVSKAGFMATGSSDTAIAIMEDLLSSSTRKQYLPSISASVSASWIQVSESMGVVLTAESNSLSVWCLLTNDDNPKTLKPVRTLLLQINDGEQGWSGIRCTGMNADGSLLAVSNDFGTRLYNFDIDQLKISALDFKKIRHKVSTVLRFIISESKHFLLSGTVKEVSRSSSNICLTLWDISTQEVVASQSGLPSAILDIEVSPNRRWCAIRLVDGMVLLYSLNNLKEYAVMPSFSCIDNIHYKNPLQNMFATENKGKSVHHMATAFTFSPDSRYLAVFSYMSRYFFIYDITSNACLTDANIAPKQAFQTTEPFIFRIQQLKGNCEDEIGRVLWRTRLCKRYPFSEEEVEMNVFLIQTKQALITRKFQIFNSASVANKSSIAEDESPLTALKVSPEEKRRRHDVLEDKTKLCGTRKTKLMFSKIYKPTDGHQFLHVSLLPSLFAGETMHSACLERLLIFTQAKKIPLDVLAPAFARKRYGT